MKNLKISKYNYMSVNLILKSTDISPSNTTSDYYGQTITTEVGKVSNNRTSFNFKNINMQSLLGQLFYDYEKFQIALIYISGSSTGVTVDENIDNRILQVKLSGIPFLSSYSQSKNLDVNTNIVSVIKIPIEASTTWSNNNTIPQYYTFTKQTIIDFKIDLHTISNDTTPNVSSINKMIGHCLFSFTIIGLDEEKYENKMNIKTFGYNK
jgi:hypothetical protein